MLNFKDYNNAASNFFVPYHLRTGLERWVEKGERPGGFLTAVLRNDLQGAFAEADGVSLKFIRGIVSFVRHETPIDCNGSEERMKSWAKSKEKTPA